MAKWTEQLVYAIIAEARKAGFITANQKLTELQGNELQFAVKEGKRTVGTMFDVCGRADLKISARGKFYLLARKLSADPQQRFMCGKAYYGGGCLSIFDSTMRQEMSVNIAACQGQAEVLRAYGIDCAIISCID